MKNVYFLKFCGILFTTLFIFVSISSFAQNGNIYSISLDGAESFFVNDDVSDNLDLTESYTFECWFNLNTYQQYDRIFDRRTVCAMSIVAANGTGDFALRFTERGSTHGVLRTLETSADYDMDLDTWYHVAVTYDASTNDAKLYINGNLAASENNSYWSLTASTNAINIGGLYNSGYSYQIAADIDEFRVSNIARDISDMQTSTHWEEYQSDANTVLLMHFNDKADSPSYVSGTGLIGTTGDDDITEFDYTDELIVSPAYLLRPSYRSQNTGNWNVLSSWEVENGADNFVDATIIPGEYSETVYVEASHTISILEDDDISVNNLEVKENGTLQIQSSSSGTGSVIINGTVTNDGTTTVQRYIVGHNNVGNAGWHILGSPVAGFDIDGSGFDPGTSDDLYIWDEITGYWLNYKAGEFTQIIPGTGYLTAWELTDTKEFTGTLNVADVSVNGLTNTPASSNPGWHMLGNPFPSALKWNDGNWNLSANVNGTAKIWNESGQSYTDVAANEVIPATNGFMVYVSASASSLTIPAASRTHDGQAWYKNTGNYIRLIASDADANNFQEHKIYVNDQATNGFDMAYDSYFLSGYAPQLFSVVDEKWLSTNSLPDFNETREIILGFQKTEAANYQIEMDTELLFPGMDLILLDTKTGVIHDFTENPIYDFMAEEGDVVERFILKFSNTASLHEINRNPFSINISNRTITISSSGATNGTVDILDISGRLIQRQQIINGYASVNPHVKTGVYILRIVSPEGTYSKKIRL